MMNSNFKMMNYNFYKNIFCNKWLKVKKKKKDEHQEGSGRNKKELQMQHLDYKDKIYQDWKILHKKKVRRRKRNQLISKRKQKLERLLNKKLKVAHQQIQVQTCLHRKGKH